MKKNRDSFQYCYRHRLNRRGFNLCSDCRIRWVFHDKIWFGEDTRK